MARVDEQTNIRLPAELKSWLKDRAIEARRSFTAEIITRLEQSRRHAKKAQHASDAA